MTQTAARKHTCYRCAAHEEGVIANGENAPALESLETTFSDGGDKVFFTSGYSAREIAQRHAQATGGQVYVNSISRKIKRPDLTVPVAYAVAKGAVYTLRPPDEVHSGVYRAYWPLL
jgi:hypothetical protein